jgi:hypothetical protein
MRSGELALDECMASTQKLKLGEILVQAGLLTESQLRSALGEHRRQGGHLGSTLIGMGLVSESVLTRALASQLNLPIVTLEGKQIHRDILDLLPADWALKQQVLPLFVREDSGTRMLFVGIGDPTDRKILEEVRHQAGMPAEAVVVPPSELEAAVARCYGSGSQQSSEDARSQMGAPGEFDALETSLDSEAPAHGSRAMPSPAELGADVGFSGGDGPSAKMVVKALAQLLIEKKLIDHEELNERVTALLEGKAKN